MQKPFVIHPRFETFPAELKSQDNWVLWRFLPPKREGAKWRKVPFQSNGKPASTTDPTTWNSFTACCEAYNRGGFDGLGYVFDGATGTDGLRYVGLDFDSCITETTEGKKEVHSIARERMRRLKTYTERSVGGTGFHSIVRAEPLGRPVHFGGVEIYSSGRYFTFTGQGFGHIRTAPAETLALVKEVQAEEAAERMPAVAAIPAGNKPPDNAALHGRSNGFSPEGAKLPKPAGAHVAGGAGIAQSNVTPQVTFPSSAAALRAGIFTPADAERLRRLFEAHGVEADDLAAGIETNIEEIRSAVAAIPPSAIASEPDWVKLARGLAHEARRYPDQAQELWEILDTVSRAAPGYDETENRRRWLRYISEALDRDNPITIASVFDMAGKHGWKGWSPPLAELTSRAGISAPSAQSNGNVVYYFPGNEQACREALDRVVAADDLVFTLNGGPLVILRVPNESALPKESRWQGDLPATTLATAADVVERAETLSWMYRRGGKGGERWKRGAPPRQFVSDYLVQMRSKYRARLLTGISRVPRIDDNGQVHFVAGYDPQTGLYHDQTPAFSVPPAPTHADAVKAAERLLAPFKHYTLEDAIAGRALLLGMIFTAIQRPFLPTAPMFAIRASMPGVGKGLLVRAAAYLAYNSLPVIATWGHSDEEFSKRFDALLIQSPAMISIDNANGRLLQGDTLEAILSEGVADVRPLGKSETVRVRNRSLIVATGNNLFISGDMARRALVLDLLPKSASPERDVYPFNPAEVVQQHRTALLQAAFTIMRAFRLAKPAQNLPGIGSFEAWARSVRDMVEWLFQYDISEGFQQNKEEDPRRQDDAALLAALYSCYGTTPFKSADVHTIYSNVTNHKRAAHLHPTKPTAQEGELHAAIETAIGSKDITAKRIGQWAKRVDGAFIENYKLDVRHNRSSNSNEMTVQRI